MDRHPSFLLVISPLFSVHLLFFLVTLVTLVLEIWDIVRYDSCPVLILRNLSRFGAVLGVIDLPTQAEVLSALVGSLAVAHLQGHGAVVTLVCAQLLVINGTSRPRSRHPGLWWRRQRGTKKIRITRIHTHYKHTSRNCDSYLARPLVGPHLQADGGVVHGWLDLNFGVIQVPPGAVCVHSCLAGALVGPHLKTNQHKKRGLLVFIPAAGFNALTITNKL